VGEIKKQGLHPDRTVGGHSDHYHSGLTALAGLLMKMFFLFDSAAG